jgi:hypothetical protein
MPCLLTASNGQLSVWDIQTRTYGWARPRSGQRSGAAVANAVGIEPGVVPSIWKCIVSGSRVNWLGEGLCGQCLPAIHLAHVELSRGEQSPEQHGGSISGWQHRPRFDPALGVGCACALPLTRKAVGCGGGPDNPCLATDAFCSGDPHCLERFQDLPRRLRRLRESVRAGSMVSRSPTSGNKPRHAGLYYDIEPHPRRDSVPNFLHGVFR